MIARVLLYQDLFDDKKPQLSELLSAIPSKIVIRILSSINADLYLENSQEKQYTIFNHLISRIDNSEKERLLNKFNNLKKTHSFFIAFPLYSNLKLIEYELLNYREVDKNETTGIDELNILKAIIITNSKYDNDKFSKANKENNLSFFQLIWLLGYEQIEHSQNGIKGLMPSLYFADSLFEFLHNEYPENYNAFLENLDIESHLEYLKNYLTLVQNGIKVKENKVDSFFNINLLTEHPFLEPFCIDMNEFDVDEFKRKNKHKDFVGLREKPIIKHSDNEFTITNWNFILNKFLLGLMFDFYHNIYPDRENKDFFKFKQNLGEEFVEKTLLKDIFLDTFTTDNEDIEFLPENEDLEHNFDFYLRIENKLFLFECKDYLMKASVKSGNIEEIETYLSKRLGRAVTQLRKQILKFNNNEYSNIQIPYPNERIFIFPIIIYTDKSFSMPGINTYLNRYLKSLLKEDNINFFHIWDLNMIHVDFFIQFKTLLKANKKILISLIDSAHHRRQSHLNKAIRTGAVDDIIKAERNFEEQIADKLIKLDDKSLKEELKDKLYPNQEQCRVGKGESHP